MKIGAISGSLRKDSYNTMLLKTIQERYEDKFELEILDISQLPLFNQDDELDPPENVKEFKEKVMSFDAMIIATPEYNWSVPGVLKNSLDWLSRGKRALVDKPVMIVGASIGIMGTIRAQLDLRRILSSPGMSARVLPPASSEFLVTTAQNKFDENGKLTDEATLQHLDKVIDHFMDFI